MMRAGIRILAAALFCAACSCADAPRGKPSEPPTVDSAFAWKCAERNASIPRRQVATEGNREALRVIRETAEELLRGVHGASCRISGGVQATTGVPFSNLVCRIPGPSDDFILVGAHHDAKLLQTAPDFQGANDGASGVGALLAMIRAVADVARKEPLPVGFRFVFFDGEEALLAYSDTDGFLGSRHEADVMERDGSLRHCRAMILLDMIGDRDLHVAFPANSNGTLVAWALAEARESGVSKFFSRGSLTVRDDDEAFAKKGVPTINFIDFDYGPDNLYWHSSADTLDKIAPESIAIAANLALRLAWRVAARKGDLP